MKTHDEVANCKMRLSIAVRLSEHGLGAAIKRG